MTSAIGYRNGVRGMRVLWLTNVALPEASHLLGVLPATSGGWLVGMLRGLQEQCELDLSVAFPCPGVTTTEQLQGDRVTYHAFAVVRKRNRRRQVSAYQEVFSAVLQECGPDLVHIHGTESPRALAMIRACAERGIPAVVSIQGLVSIIWRHFYSDLPMRVVYGMSPKEVLTGVNVAGARRSLRRNGIYEAQAIRECRHIIGRSTFDKACVAEINPDSRYHFCNETLRDAFYEQAWSIDECERGVIFLSQGQYPIKGLHYMLEAMPAIVRRFPWARLVVGGDDPTRAHTVRDKICRSRYGMYIAELIRSHNLESHVTFTGSLSEEEMCRMFLRCHIFVSPSSIENSSNSLSEAQLLGVPCIASYVGGVADMVDHGVDGLHYQHNAPYMLAHHVCRILEDDALALTLSEGARRSGALRADRATNASNLASIYQTAVHEATQDSD